MAGLWCLPSLLAWVHDSGMTTSLKPILLALLVSTLPAVQVGAEAKSPLASLAALRWQYRVLLIFDHAADTKQLDRLEKAAPAILERDMAWFLLDGDRLHSNYPGQLSRDFRRRLRERYDEGAAVVLIGKDGGVKMRDDTLDLTVVFARIDSMPMRLQEMRRSQGS